MFSIVMPYYKNAHIVKRSVDSIIAQTVKDFELLIVDDGSEDNIDDIISEYGDSRITVLHKKNGGVSSTRNFGISNAKGEYVCFLDSDDAWCEDHLEELSSMIDKYPENSFFITSHLRIGNSEVSSSDALVGYEDVFVEEDFIRLCFAGNEVIHTNSVCLKREFLMADELFNTSASIGEDTDLWFRCAMRSPVVVSKKVTTKYYRDNSFLTKNRKFNYDWPFLEQYKKAQSENLYSVKLMCDRHLLAGCKHKLADGDKKGSRQLLKKVEKPLGGELKKAYIVAKALTLLPLFVSQRICVKVYEKQRSRY